jgi:metal-dependent amidase/aminoacylase/carboxypeptidase family protein
MSNDPAADLLQEALNIVTGARRQSYGTPEDNFATIAALWATYLRRRGFDFTDPEQGIAASDVAAMMVLMKIARLAETPDHKDSWLDTAGYAACGWRCATPRQLEIPFPPRDRSTPHGVLMQMHDAAEAEAAATAGDIELCTCDHSPICYNDDGVCQVCGAVARKI